MTPDQAMIEIELWRASSTVQIRERFARIRVTSGPAPLDGYATLDRWEADHIAKVTEIADDMLAQVERGDAR